MKGLTTQQVQELLKQYGENSLIEAKKRSFFLKFIDQFRNFLTLLLIAAALLSFFIGETVDGMLIIAIVFLNACFGIYQEAKAENAIAALKKITISKVRVIRDGGEEEIESRFLVPGDICFIEEGVKVPADGDVVQSMNLEVNESVLTGESLSVSKKIQDELYSGTIIAKGRGLFVVTKTGMQTKFGTIAQNLSTIDDSATPLQKKLEDLTRMIGIVGIIAAVVVFIISFLHGTGYFPAFLLAISLAVAVVPEGLPAVMTITLSLGVKEMSRRKSVIRRLSAIEALGSVTLIATDKTGTLTTNKMKVKEVYVDDLLYADSKLPRIENHPFSLLVRNGILCSTASLVYVHDHGSWDILGDPTEGSLLYLAKETGLEVKEIRENWKVVEEVPFDSVTKRMSVVVQNQNGDKTIFTKGAPESILEIISSIQKGNMVEKFTVEERKKIENVMENWARKGLRVLAFSYSGNKTNDQLPISNYQSNSNDSITKLKDENYKLKIENSQVFLGMVAIHDAPRPEVQEAVLRAKKAGIKVVMITGDNEKTAEAIGVTAGIIYEGAEILTGKQIEEYSDAQLLEVLPRVSIFARTTPFHKHRIVKLYQKLGEIVAVTGDGVNDAIALKQADVGVAMGLVGTDVARETADMVITDDNFASIVNAIEEGRNIIKNLKNAIIYLLSCNMTEALVLIGGLILGFDHIFFPIQLLYINLITDGIPALSLAFSPRDPHLMQQSPEKTLTLLKKHERTHIIFMSLMGSVLILGSFFLFLTYYGDGVADAAAFSVLTLIQSFILIDLWISNRSLHKHILSLTNPVFLIAFIFPFIAQYLIVSYAMAASWFKIAPVSWQTYFIFIGISSIMMLGIRAKKHFVKML